MIFLGIFFYFWALICIVSSLLTILYSIRSTCSLQSYSKKTFNLHISLIWGWKLKFSGPMIFTNVQLNFSRISWKSEVFEFMKEKSTIRSLPLLLPSMFCLFSLMFMIAAATSRISLRISEFWLTPSHLFIFLTSLGSFALFSGIGVASIGHPNYTVFSESINII